MRRSSGRRFRRSRRAANTIGIVPVTMGVGAALSPFVAPTGTMNGSVLGEVIYAIQTKDYNGFKVAGQSLPTAIWTALPTMIGLGAGAAGLSWAARKFGLRSATRVSKKVSVF